MVTIDIKSVQQIIHRKITFGHTIDVFLKKANSFEIRSKNVFFSHLLIRKILQE